MIKSERYYFWAGVLDAQEQTPHKRRPPHPEWCGSRGGVRPCPECDAYWDGFFAGVNESVARTLGRIPGYT